MAIVLAAIAALLMSHSAALAQRAPRPPHGALTNAGAAADGRRDGHSVIRMRIASAAQLQRVLDFGAEPLSCIIGPGQQQDFCVSPAALRRIEHADMRFAVLQQDIQALIDAERERLFAPENQHDHEDGGLAGGDAWFADFKTYPQVSAYMDALVALQPGLASKLTAGTTLEGRTIHALRITGPNGGPNKPAALITGCQHAREWVAVMTPMYVADALVRGYGVDSRITALLERVEFFIIPIVNPDGYEYTYAPAPNGDRLWRKNRRDNGNGTFGVDLNRNWSVDWGGPHSTSSNTSSDVYPGAGAFSEPETAAVRDFIIARPQIVAHIDFHSYSQLILQSWAHSHAEHAEYDLVDAIGRAMNRGIHDQHAMQYRNGWGGTLLYLASGVMPDWCYGERGIISYTIELRDQGTYGFVLPASQILPTCQENLPAVLELAERATAGAAFFFPHGLPATVTQLQPTLLRVDIRPTPQATLAPSSATLQWRIGSSGAFTPVAMSALGGGQYEAALPALACGQRIEYFFEVQNAAGTVTYRSPADAPASTHSAVAARSALAYDFQSARGWTTSVAGATTGHWQRGVPVNDVNWPYDPRHDADGSGACWLTQNAAGNTDVDNGSVLLTSPAIDAAALLNAGEQASLSYAWFLHHTSPAANDTLKVEASSSGTAGPWMQIALHGESGGALWRRQTFTQAQLGALGVTLTSATALRFTATDANPQTIVEAAVDDVRIWGDCGSTSCPADVTRSGAVDVDDLIAVILAWGHCAPPCTADVAPPGGSGAVDVDDLIAVILGWGACP